ncbi:sensor histidine kinase [Spirochaeta dissipatitropha]
MQQPGSLFRRTFLAFLASFLVMICILAAALTIGYRQATSVWSERRSGMIEQNARQILQTRQGGTELPIDIPFTVYDSEGNVIASNRGEGRRREAPMGPPTPLRQNEGIVGYYSAGNPVFRNDAANQALADSMFMTAIIGSIAALIAAAGAAWIFTRSLTSPAARIAQGLDSIAHGQRDKQIPETGTEEIVLIARSANMLMQRLADEERLRSQWAQDVTHDLRTPVASIRSQLEAIVDGVYTADPARISGTLKELERMERLINDLDELMQLEEPRKELVAEEFPARDFAQALQQRFEIEMQKKKLQWTEDVSCTMLYGNEPLLYRAVSNILANAVRHCQNGGTIHIRMQSAETDPVMTEICIQNSNNGQEIPQEDIPRLFERLYRGEYARNSPGSGLGLTIAKRICALHGGAIRVESNNEATSFCIQILGSSQSLHDSAI